MFDKGLKIIGGPIMSCKIQVKVYLINKKIKEMKCKVGSVK